MAKELDLPIAFTDKNRVSLHLSPDEIGLSIVHTFSGGIESCLLTRVSGPKANWPIYIPVLGYQDVIDFKTVDAFKSHLAALKTATHNKKLSEFVFSYMPGSNPYTSESDALSDLLNVLLQRQPA